jgi:double-stranded uracil-DNA glycosylase
MLHKLPDVLRPGLKVVFCGSAAGAASAELGAYYAGPGNRFWRTLFEIGLTPRRLRPDEFYCLLDFGIGLTDVAKTASGADAIIPTDAFDRARLAERMRALRPALLAFNGKKAASVFLDRPTSGISYGRVDSEPGSPPITVLPSTSGAASRYWDLAPWHSLARLLSV